MSASSYPLAWPIGHARTPRECRQHSRFGTTHWNTSKRITLSQVLALLQGELDRLKARDVVLSTNLELRLDGLPRSGQAQPADPGVAVYFTLRGKPLVLPCDAWTKVECNLMAIVKHIEATRGMDRWGVGTVERCFDGFAALPEKSSGTPWWDVLRVSPHGTADEIHAAFKLLAQVAHPDRGGDVERWHEISEARQLGLQAVGSGGEQGE